MFTDRHPTSRIGVLTVMFQPRREPSEYIKLAPFRNTGNYPFVPFAELFQRKKPQNNYRRIPAHARHPLRRGHDPISRHLSALWAIA